MSADTLFDLPEEQDRGPSIPTSPEEARVLRPVRNQVEMIMRDLDSLVSLDHPARSIWGLLEKLDLSEFYGSIKAVLTRPGRSTTDPRVLLAVWLLATVESVSSSRKLERLCQEHDAYRWLCGGAPINYHMLSDFRTAHRQALDGLLTQIVVVDGSGRRHAGGCGPRWNEGTCQCRCSFLPSARDAGSLSGSCPKAGGASV
jgi:transposase